MAARLNRGPTPEEIQYLQDHIPTEGIKKVARDLGISKNTIRLWAREIGVHYKTPGELTPEIAEFVKTHHVIRSKRWIAKKLGVARQTIDKWYLALNLECFLDKDAHLLVSERYERQIEEEEAWLNSPVDNLPELVKAIRESWSEEERSARWIDGTRTPPPLHETSYKEGDL